MGIVEHIVGVTLHDPSHDLFVFPIVSMAAMQQPFRPKVGVRIPPFGYHGFFRTFENVM
jgi:hypothetical protein